MSLTAAHEIVVGIDGSSYALAAAKWAATEAADRGFGVVLVRALPWPFVDAPALDLDDAIEIWQRDEATAELAQAESQVLAVAPSLAVRRVANLAHPAQLLFDASPAPAMIVIGEHGKTTFGGLMAGSTAIQVATHATVPVVVVRGHTEPAGGIVVGVDGSAESADAIAFAFDAAARRHAPLVAVHTWFHPISTGPSDMLPLVVAGHQEAEDRMVAEAMAGWADKFPDVSVSRRVTRGHPAPALVEASTTAQLVVLGSRGHGGFSGLLIGSVGLALLHRAQCPVAIIRPVPADKDRRDE